MCFLLTLNTLNELKWVNRLHSKLTCSFCELVSEASVNKKCNNILIKYVKVTDFDKSRSIPKDANMSGLEYRDRDL